MRPLDIFERTIGRDWPLFAYTMVGIKRLDNVQMAIETVARENIPGDFIETGVWRGGTSIFARACLKAHGLDRTVWLADSFEGLPPSEDPKDTIELSDTDYFAVPLKVVQEGFRRFGLLDERVKFIEGWFSDTLHKAPIERLAILRLDGDMYTSTMDALSALYSKVSPGGFVIIDDYHTWEPCRRAVLEFLSAQNLDPEIHDIDLDSVYWRV